MKVFGPFLVVLLTAALAGSASAQAPGFARFTGEPQLGGATPGRGKGKLVGDATTPGAPGTAKRTPLKKRCQRKPGRRTCRYTRAGRLVKVCVKRRGRRVRCRDARGAAFSAAAQARASVLRGHGYTSPIMRAVGRFYWLGANNADKGWCSGTMIRRGLVLTAAHCLYADSKSNINGYNQFFFQDAAEIRFTPGNYAAGGQGNYPYGVWQVVRSWVPTGYTNGSDEGLDWGIVELAPDANGNYPGDITGTWGAYWNAYLPRRAHFYSVGYPASGAFSSAEWTFGNGQYFCDTTWDGYNVNGSPLTGNSFAIYVSPCPMNGGASGGPVFAEFVDGSWGIVGVNNLGDSAGNAPGRFATENITFWLDNRFGQFWNSVINPGAARVAHSNSLRAVHSGGPR